VVLAKEITKGWVLEVKDTGPGISELDEEHIFEKHYRGGDHASDGETGSGLGLSIVKPLTGALGGNVSYSSGIREGVIFRISLPRK